MRKFLGVFFATAMVAGQTFAQPLFTPVQVPSHQYLGEWEHYVGGGLSTFDCNDDGFPEIFAAGGSAPSALLVNKTKEVGARPEFELETPESLLLTGISGAYPLDIDNDGLIDLAVLRVGENVLLRGTGSCNFVPFNTLSFGAKDDWTTGFSATWEGNNALPTLAFGNYVDRHDPEGPFEACDSNLLYRPTQTGYDATTILEPGYCSLSVLFSDWSRSGRQDLRVSNDRHYYVRDGSEQLWNMSGTPHLYTEEDGWKTYKIWGMGIASRDITGDGFQEVYLTSMGDQKMQSPSGIDRPQFDDYTYERGTTAHRPYTGGDGRPSTGWHVAFGDVENNGRDDIFVAKGNVERMAGAAMDDPNNLLVQTPDGNFTENGDLARIATLARSRGAALVDFNADGLLDLAVNNRKADLELYQNTSTQTGNWLSIELLQDGVNTNAVGAFIEVKAGDTLHTREITIGGGHAGGHLGPQHFGLGANDVANVRVIWRDQTTTDWKEFSSNESHTIKRSDTP